MQNGFFDGLLTGFAQQWGKNQQIRQEQDQFNKSLQAQADFNNTLKNVDLGGQTTIQDNASRANGGNYTGSNIDKQTTQGLLPTNFSQQPPQPSANTLGQGLVSGMGQTPQPAQAQQNFFAMPTPQTPEQQAEQAKYDQFALAKKANPEWYVGDNYVGNDAQARADAVKAQQSAPVMSQPQAQPISQYSTANNPATLTTSAPKTIQEQTSIIKSQIPLAMKDLMTKYPTANPKELYAMLQQATNDKIAEHTATYNDSKIQDLMKVFNDPKTTGNQKAWLAAQAKKMYGVDIGSEFKNFNVSPDAQFKEEQANSRWLTPSGNTRLTTDTSIKTTGMNNENAQKVANINGQYKLQGAQISANRPRGNGSTNTAFDKKQAALENKYVEVRRNLKDAIDSNDEASAMRWMKEMNSEEFMTNDVIADVARSDGTALMNKWNSQN